MIKTALASHDRSFSLVSPKEPNLYREIFPYDSVPRTRFDGTIVPPSPPEAIWITDTTFRDGQQARPPYTPEQIVTLYDMLHRLDGGTGVIRQCEFFPYSKRDRKAIEGCVALGHRYPEITGWIRANEDDFKLIVDLGLKETGVLTSVSDYHIYLKLKSDRKTMMDKYVGLVETALEAGVVPRCHFEDVTRADIYGFCLPLAARLLELSESSGIGVKLRLCDTLGYGVPYPGIALPRSVPKLVNAFVTELGFPSERIEWHGHNDFHKVHANGVAAWLHGVSALNASLLGFGERTGNPPLEAAVIEYLSLTGEKTLADDLETGLDTTVISEIADYYRSVVHADVPTNYPFVGSEFNVTRAGIHADGILKNQEIYNIFDTDRLLNRPIRVMVTDKSGLAGIARWINENVPLILDATLDPVSKRHPGVRRIFEWVSEQYAQGRTTSISEAELIAQAKHRIPSLFTSEFSRVRGSAMRLATHIADRVSDFEIGESSDIEKLEGRLSELINDEGSIQLLAVTNTGGQRISQVHTQRGEKSRFRNLLTKDFREKEWFRTVLETGEAYYSDLFFSKYTGELICTAAIPLVNPKGDVTAVVDIDFKFEELSKLIDPLPEDVV